MSTKWKQVTLFNEDGLPTQQTEYSETGEVKNKTLFDKEGMPI
jgi:hypothetical protein